MVCCLLDVCGLWLCLSPISVFAVVRVPTGPAVNAPYGRPLLRPLQPQETSGRMQDG